MTADAGIEAVADLRERTVTAGGVEIVVRPIVVGQLPGFIKAIKPLLATLNSGQVDPVVLITESPDSVLQAISVATGMAREQLDKFQLDELVELAGAVLEINADFFTRRVLPTLTRVMQVLNQIGVGATRSSS